ncbi:unnamed protein product [Thelazia callipaeda]|uniref:Intraflagellar transport protein 57 homolog n=1 Tax=Thelazia callipaeda TaxID=103827 RepID=A0A0N5CUB4_THECL|nr:unnamed protein product [Thelazia callipaeda]
MEENEDGKKIANQCDENETICSQQYNVYIFGDELNDKLKLLNYEENYANLDMSYRTISREYFVRSTNVGEQFFIFTTLSAWLIRISVDPKFAFPRESDDPNGVISNILNVLRSKNISIDFSPNKLKSGAGVQCLYVLNKLADLALIATEITAEEFEEIDQQQQIDIADDEDHGIDIDLQALPLVAEQPLESILKSDTDVTSWKAEVERAAPQLKIIIRQDAKDWRNHLEQMQTLQTVLKELLNSAQPLLKGLASDLSSTMERIAIRENHLNNELQAAMTKFRAAKDNLAEANEKYKTIGTGIAERTAKLQRVCDELEQVKQQIEETSSRNNDGAPMLRLKQALQKMESEIVKMNVQISVMQQSILQSQLKNRAAFNAYF